MLETANWIQTFFDLSSDATFIFQADQLVVANQAGQDLIDAFDYCSATVKGGRVL